MLKLVMFDLDGTLVDTARDIHDAINDVLARRGGWPVSEALVRSWIGHGSMRLLRSAFNHACAAEDLHFDDDVWSRSLIAEYSDCYLARCGGRSQLFPAVVETLDALASAGMAMAIVTNREAHLAHAVLGSHQLAARFDPIICGDSLAQRKPSAMPLRFCLDRHGVAPQQALMVGDSAVDAGAASAAGVACALVRYGYNGGQSLDGLGVRFVVDALSELPLFDWPG